MNDDDQQAAFDAAERCLSTLGQLPAHEWGMPEVIAGIRALTLLAMRTSHDVNEARQHRKGLHFAIGALATHMGVDIEVNVESVAEPDVTVYEVPKPKESIN